VIALTVLYIRRSEKNIVRNKFPTYLEVKSFFLQLTLQSDKSCPNK